MPAAHTPRMIEQDAALVVLQWKREFASNLRRQASRIAESAGETVINLDHYRQAIPAAMQSVLSVVSAAFDEEDNERGKAKVA